MRPKDLVPGDIVTWAIAPSGITIPFRAVVLTCVQKNLLPVLVLAPDCGTSFAISAWMNHEPNSVVLIEVSKEVDLAWTIIGNVKENKS